MNTPQVGSTVVVTRTSGHTTSTLFGHVEAIHADVREFQVTGTIVSEIVDGVETEPDRTETASVPLTNGIFHHTKVL
jgi:hypothetical protein